MRTKEMGRGKRMKEGEREESLVKLVQTTCHQELYP